MSSSSSSTCVLIFDTAVYRLTALKKAAYKFSGRCIVNIELTGDRHATLTVQSSDPSAALQPLITAIHREVIDQELREVILEETSGLRNLLLAQAFSATSLIEPRVDTEDYTSDPLGITASDAAPPVNSKL